MTGLELVAGLKAAILGYLVVMGGGTPPTQIAPAGQITISRALDSCDMSGAELVQLGRLCPYHSGEEVAGLFVRDGLYGHTHYRNPSREYRQDHINVELAHKAVTAIKGTKKTAASKQTSGLRGALLR